MALTSKAKAAVLTALILTGLLATVPQAQAQRGKRTTGGPRLGPKASTRHAPRKAPSAMGHHRGHTGHKPAAKKRASKKGLRPATGKRPQPAQVRKPVRRPARQPVVDRRGLRRTLPVIGRTVVDRRPAEGAPMPPDDLVTRYPATLAGDGEDGALDGEDGIPGSDAADAAADGEDNDAAEEGDEEAAEVEVDVYIYVVCYYTLAGEKVFYQSFFNPADAARAQVILRGRGLDSVVAKEFWRKGRE